jgi:hypothetical protein
MKSSQTLIDIEKIHISLENVSRLRELESNPVFNGRTRTSIIKQQMDALEEHIDFCLQLQTEAMAKFDAALLDRSNFGYNSSSSMTAANTIVQPASSHEQPVLIQPVPIQKSTPAIVTLSSKPTTTKQPSSAMIVPATIPISSVEEESQESSQEEDIPPPPKPKGRKQYVKHDHR